jgi:hypothetical protein
MKRRNTYTIAEYVDYQGELILVDRIGCTHYWLARAILHGHYLDGLNSVMLDKSGGVLMRTQDFTNTK